MIMICLRGGFGNQLFEYAFGRLLSQKNATELRLNTWFYSQDNAGRFRSGYTPNNPNGLMRTRTG